MAIWEFITSEFFVFLRFLDIVYLLLVAWKLLLPVATSILLAVVFYRDFAARRAVERNPFAQPDGYTCPDCGGWVALPSEGPHSCPPR